MKTTDIAKTINNSSLDNLIPLQEIKTEKDKELKILNFKNIMYFTEDEFKEKFPNINTKNIYYCLDGFFPKIVYHDIDKYIYFELPFANNELIKMSVKGNVTSEECILKGINDMEKNYEERNTTNLLMPCTDRVRLELLSKMADDKKFEDVIYDAVMDWYTYCDFGFSALGQEKFQKIVSKRSKENIEEAKERIEKLEDTVVVYRGEGSESTNYKKSFSWTLDENIANFFACRYSDTARIIKGVVNKADIIDYLKNRNEEEVIVSPKDVKKITIENFYSMKDIQNKIRKIAEIYGNYKYVLREEIEFTQDSNDHSKLHCLRVLFYALLIAEDLKLSEVERHILAQACIFHDAGRNNDEEDSEHGKYSYEIFKNMFFERNDIKFLLEYHCKDDKEAFKYLKSSNIDDKHKIKKMFKILKDADALDRVRFGIKGLDTKYLRFEESKKYILVAVKSQIGLTL